MAPDPPLRGSSAQMDFPTSIPDDEPTDDVTPAFEPAVPKRGFRFRDFWARNRTLFWTLHSLWALATGVIVILLARDRYGFVPWVVLFLVLTWASTLFFGGRVTGERIGTRRTAPPGLGEEATSYATRSMYQETLFFLLPFYWYSTSLLSVNLAFPLLLAGLAIFSCLDLVFDGWMRRSRVFGLVFFATVAFAALNLLIPILLPVDPRLGTPIAALVAVGSALPLTLRGTSTGRSGRVRIGLASVAILAIAIGLPRLVPPVPLRMQSAVFTSELDRSALIPADTLTGPVDSAALDGSLYLLVQVFAPSSMPTTVTLEWRRNGEVVRTTRDIEITAHEVGFRVWDRWAPNGGVVPSGSYRVTLRTGGRRVFGTVGIRVED
jgi:hypothetical protein